MPLAADTRMPTIRLVAMLMGGTNTMQGMCPGGVKFIAVDAPRYGGMFRSGNVYYESTLYALKFCTREHPIQSPKLLYGRK